MDFRTATAISRQAALFDLRAGPVAGAKHLEGDPPKCGSGRYMCNLQPVGHITKKPYILTSKIIKQKIYAYRTGEN